MGFQNQNQTLGWEPPGSRWSAPAPGKRTRREDHALSHRPQMSSDRLFLDRVARQHCPSPLHRHTQINMHSADAQAKGDISTLPARGTFLLCLDNKIFRIDTGVLTSYDITRDVLIVSDPTLLVLASLPDRDKHGYAMMEDGGPSWTGLFDLLRGA